MSATLEAWKLIYGRSQLACIPLRPDSKQPVCNAWQTRPPAQQWREVRDKTLNIGVLAGGGLAVVDCDDPQAAASVGSWLEGVGLRPPVVATPSGGKHFYLRVKDVPAGFNWKILSPLVGRGELRARNCYVAAPCSSLLAGSYQFTGPGIETYPGLRAIAWKDLVWFVGAPAPTGGSRPEAPGARRPAPVRPVSLAWRHLRPEVIAQLQGLRDWPVGTAYGRFLSASEAEESCIASMILAGWSYGQIRAAFDAEQPGAYMRRGDRRENYLKLSYNNALEELATTLPRPELAAAYVELALWDLPTYDRKALRALLALCWASDYPAWQVSASLRQLAEQAGCGRHAMYNALKRLQVDGLLVYILDGSGVGRFDLALLSSKGDIRHKGGSGLDPAIMGEIDQKVSTPVVPRAAAARSVENLPGGMEIWSAGLLGASAELVYGRLTTDPMSAAELASLTGKGVRTCERALDHLQVFGLAVGAGRPALWVRGSRPVADVALELGAPLAATRRRQRHERERESYERWRERGKVSTERGETRTTNDSKQLQVRL
jgi:Bifunctional DNA primase/polymerase, N-terminal